MQSNRYNRVVSSQDVMTQSRRASPLGQRNLEELDPSADIARMKVVGVWIDPGSWNSVLDRIERWAQSHASKYVCLTNVHSIVTANRWNEFADVLAASDLSLPDGAPVAWMLRRMGVRNQQRINGPDLMRRLCERSAAKQLGVYLYGNTQSTLDDLRTHLISEFPALRIVGAHSPPFRPLTPDESRDVIAEINSTGAHIVFVSLGCPKQETWMATNRDAIAAVLVGVGAAFDYHAKRIKRAPDWMQRLGLEWLHRLISEPRRLWRRYLVTNTWFIVGAIRQLLFTRK